jgi:hypothetical protein
MLRLKLSAALIVFGAVGVGVSEADKTMNYVPTDAYVKTAKVECFVKSGRKHLVNKGTNSMAYMDCELAPLAAKQFGYDESAVQERVEFTYTYQSPVDGSMQSGKHVSDGSDFKYRKGVKFSVYAHKTEAGKSRVN